MPQLRPPLTGIAAIAIVSGALLLGSSMLASACPFSGSGNSGSPRNANNFMGLNGSDNRERSSGNDGSEFSFRQSDELNRGNASGLAGNSGQLNSGQLNVTRAEVAGLGAVVGLFVLAILYKVRRNGSVAPTEAALLSKFPFLEHPEMVLTLVPQEALSSSLEMEYVAPRYSRGDS